MKKLPLSFEMFPPGSEAGRAALAETVERLADVASGGFSVTMGAGGSTHGGTHETAKAIVESSGRPVMAHLIAMGHNRADALEMAEQLWQDGISSILALRGDLPREGGMSTDSFSHASELVAALKERRDFDISVAAYPERHPEAGSLDADIDHLKEKLDAGASRAICQFVLDPAHYARFLDACERHGVDAPIVPGLMPINNWARIESFAKANGTRIPDDLARMFLNSGHSAEDHKELAAEVLLDHARRLESYGAPALHVYALNRWELPLALAREIGR
jgi:methylenetetrahydrofolate reductase (NADPH)